MAEKTTGVIFVGVIVGLLILILGAPIKSIITPPEAIPVAQYNEKFCPDNLYFQSYSNKTSPFSVKFQNIGDDGSLFVALHSDSLLSKTKNEGEYKLNSTMSWLLNSRQYQDFNFELMQNNSMNLENFTIYLDYGCYKSTLGYNFYCKQYSRCCSYQKNKDDSNKYLLKDAC